MKRLLIIAALITMVFAIAPYNTCVAADTGKIPLPPGLANVASTRNCSAPIEGSVMYAVLFPAAPIAIGQAEIIAVADTNGYIPDAVIALAADMEKILTNPNLLTNTGSTTCKSSMKTSTAAASTNKAGPELLSGANTIAGGSLQQIIRI